MCILLIKTIIKANWYTRVRYLLDNLCLSELEYKKMKMRKYYVNANAGNTVVNLYDGKTYLYNPEAPDFEHGVASRGKDE